MKIIYNREGLINQLFWSFSFYLTQKQINKQDTMLN